MKRSFLVLTLALVFLLMVSGIGSTMVMEKLVTIPTADMITTKGYISGEIYNNEKKILEGIFLAHPRLEMGGMARLEKGEDDPELGLNAKTVLVDETQYEPTVAAGVKMDDIYLVMSKSFGYGIRAHLGVGNGELGGVFAGVNKVFNPVQVEGDFQSGSSLPTINLMGEYINDQINLGMRVDLQENLTLDFAVLDFDDLKLGLGFSF
ncbi:MAG: hypothetical protein PWR10_711 [Halanaerobiales bacterium]|nr:hypothetical protein [Halanaerobiales bacterium]